MKIEINVKGMHCGACEMLIKDSLEDEEGIKNVKVSNGKGLAIINFDEKKISESDIKHIIKREGYEVE